MTSQPSAQGARDESFADRRQPAHRLLWCGITSGNFLSRGVLDGQVERRVLCKGSPTPGTEGVPMVPGQGLFSPFLLTTETQMQAEGRFFFLRHGEGARHNFWSVCLILVPKKAVRSLWRQPFKSGGVVRFLYKVAKL